MSLPGESSLQHLGLKYAFLDGVEKETEFLPLIYSYRQGSTFSYLTPFNNLL